MRLRELGEGCFEVPAGISELEVTGLACDSREVRPGSLFVAVPGDRLDGHAFIPQAEAAGAIAIVAEVSTRKLRSSTPAAGRPRVPCFQVRDSRAALGLLAASFYGTRFPGLAVAGVTGTKGKTTTAWILDAIFRSAGKVSALFGTVHNRVAGRLFPSLNTTPSCLDLHRCLKQLLEQGGTHAAMEVSSHGIQQQRIAGIDFRCGIFTNVAPEHLDYHKTFESYVDTKVGFFEGLSPSAHAVLPRDESASQGIAARIAASVAWYGAESQDGVECLRMSPEGMSFAWKGKPVRSRLWGIHNLLNLLGAMTAAECMGFSRDEIAAGAESAVAPPGRLEKIEHDRPFQVFVDYAHTDGSLETVLRALRPITPGRLITIFGCGGDRDRLKRPRMGRAAEKWSDHIVITSDNPRSEDPRCILDDIKAGLEKPDDAVFEVDRREAIALGIRMAMAHDTVLIAGKGHETYQELKDEKVHFDDREVAREFLAEGTVLPAY